MLTKFFVPMIPPTVTFQEKRLGKRKNGKPFIYSDNSVREAKSKLEAHLAGHKPAVPFEGAVMLVVKWCFPLKAKHSDGEYKTSKPDTDNLQKLLKDVMTKLGYWKDDAQVCSEHIEKFWAKTPGIFVYIEEL